MKKIVAVLVFLVMLAPAFGAVKTVKQKSATPEAKAAILQKVKAKIGAAQAMTKAPTPEAAKPAVKKEIKFKDLAAKHPSYPYVKKMVLDYEVISGYPDGTFKPNKTINRAEFSKVTTKALNYLEKRYEIPLADTPAVMDLNFKDLPKNHWSYPTVSELVMRYKILTGYPDNTFKPNKTINRFELATVLAKAMKKIYERYELTLPTLESKVKFNDVKEKHWAINDIKLLAYFGIMEGKVKGKGKTKQVLFEGNKEATRLDATITVAKFIDKCNIIISKIPKDKLEALKRKYGVKKAEVPPSELAEKAMVMGKPQAYISSGYGNINESGSGTNNWMGFMGSAQYGNSFKLWNLSADYELSGKASYNQIVYLAPGGGGGIIGGTVGENRYDLDANTVFPIVDFYGYQGKLLLGLKYAVMNNPFASTNFTALNAGVATVMPVFGYNVLGRAFYSLLPFPAAKNASALGLPVSILNYEASTGVEIFKTPLLVGYSGETMFINGGTFTRFYNLFFVRYSLI